jgi:hypothetical protein
MFHKNKGFKVKQEISFVLEGEDPVNYGYIMCYN